MRDTRAPSIDIFRDISCSAEVRIFAFEAWQRSGWLWAHSVEEASYKYCTDLELETVAYAQILRVSQSKQFIGRLESEREGERERERVRQRQRDNAASAHEPGARRLSGTENLATSADCFQVSGCDLDDLLLPSCRSSA